MSTMYLVVRRAVRDDGSGCGDQASPDTGSRVPLRLFAARGAAERLVAELTAEARRTMNPFHLNDYDVPEPVRKYLKKLRISACPKEVWAEQWEEWWDRCAGELTDDQRAAVWALFGALVPYEVVEIEVDDE